MEVAAAFELGTSTSTKQWSTWRSSCCNIALQESDMEKIKSEKLEDTSFHMLSVWILRLQRMESMGETQIAVGKETCFNVPVLVRNENFFNL